MSHRIRPQGSDREDGGREYISGLARSDGACPTRIQKAAERTVCVGDKRWPSVRECQTHAAQAHSQIVADDPRNKKVGFEARSGIEFAQLNGRRRNSARGQGERSRSVCRIRVGEPKLGLSGQCSNSRNRKSGSKGRSEKNHCHRIPTKIRSRSRAAERST